MQNKTNEELTAEVKELRVKLEEAQETLDAIMRGEVDGLIVSTPKGEQVYTITGAEKPYRALIEDMREGAVILSDDNTILYCNNGFAKMMRQPRERIVGVNIESLASLTHTEPLKELLISARKRKRPITKEITLQTRDNILVPTLLSVNSPQSDTLSNNFLVVTNLTQHMEEEVKQYTNKLETEIVERKKAEEEIAKLAKFPLENPAAVLRVDRKGIILFANPAASENLKDWQIKVGQEAPEPIRLTVVEALVSGNKIEFEEKNGEEIFSFWVAPIVTEGYANLYGRKITKRKKAEEAIRRQAALIDLSPDAIITRTLEGTISFWNKGAEKMYGWTAQEAIGQTSHILLKTKFPEPLKDIVSKVKTAGRWEGELVHQTKDGRVLAVQSWWLAEKDEKGVTKNLLESNVDITDRKIAEEKLRESKVWEATSFYTRNLIEASLDPLVTISAEGKITDVNKATENVTGCSREELIGSDFSSYFTEPKKAAAGYKQVFTEGVVRDYPVAIRHKSGKVTEVLYNASLYRNTEGIVQGVFAAARDVTERKKLEKQLKESERLATIGATAGMVGHDIRNPLQAITSDVYLAKSDLSAIPEGEAKENLQESLIGIEKNVEYINKIVQDLQDYARPLSLVAKEIDVEAVFNDVLVKKAVPRSIKVSRKVEAGAGKVVSDFDLLKRILANLTSNAVQAMPDGGKLTVRARREGKDLLITVEDTGVGIPEEAKSKLFTPLFTTKSKGQGFGLVVVKRMTEALGGTISFESEVGKGTKFILRLPSKELNGK